MVHAPCHHNAPRPLSSKCSVTPVITMLHAHSHHSVPCHLSSQCPMTPVITVLHAVVFTMLHGPLSSQCSMVPCHCVSLCLHNAPWSLVISQMAISDPVLSRDLASPPTHGLLSNPPPMGALWPLAGRVVVLRLRGCESEGTGPRGGHPAALPEACNHSAGPARLRFTLCG